MISCSEARPDRGGVSFFYFKRDLNVSTQKKNLKVEGCLCGTVEKGEGKDKDTVRH